MVDMSRTLIYERAIVIVAFEGIRSGKLSLSRVLTLGSQLGDGRPVRSVDFLTPEFIHNYDELRYLGFMNRMVELSRMPYVEGLRKIRSLEKEMTPVPLIFSMTRLFLPGLTRAVQSKFRIDAALCTAKVALRLLIHKSEHGRFPETLEELGGDIPSDPFTGKSLIYRHDDEGFVLYSVGVNLTDDGGRKTRDRKDTVFRFGTRY